MKQVNEMKIQTDNIPSVMSRRDELLKSEQKVIRELEKQLQMPYNDSFESEDEIVVFEKPVDIHPIEPLKPMKLPSVGLRPPKPQGPPRVLKSLKDG
jgi:hypothetical protein